MSLPVYELFAIRYATGAGRALGVALLDVSTGEFTATEYLGADGVQAFADELTVLRPREVVVASDHHGLDGPDPIGAAVQPPPESVVGAVLVTPPSDTVELLMSPRW